MARGGLREYLLPRGVFDDARASTQKADIRCTNEMFN
jgi:hypothetical protein